MCEYLEFCVVVVDDDDDNDDYYYSHLYNVLFDAQRIL